MSGKAALRVRAWGSTNVGRVRELNEDTFFTGETVFAVADGMGGHAAGEVASATAVGPLQAVDGTTYRDPQAATDALAGAVSEANELVLAKAAEDPELKGMGTTLTTVMVRGSRLHLAHVGDSRAYLLRGGVLTMLTEDHTLVAQMVKEGRITEEQALVHPHRSVITRAIGVEAGVAVDTLDPFELEPGDQVLLCSDGLTGPVTEPVIAEILAGEADGARACQRLIDAANAGGGQDNITCVLLRAEGEGAGPATGVAPLLQRGNDDVTEDLGDPDELQQAAERSGVAAATPEQLDARRLVQLNDGDPDIDTTPPELRNSRGRRTAAIITGIVVLLLVVGGFGTILARGSYFIASDADGDVWIYRGLDVPLVSVLSERHTDTQIDLDELPPRLQDTLEDGVPVESLDAAEEYVENTLRPEVIDPEDDEPAELPTDEATDEPTPTPRETAPATTSTTPPAAPAGQPTPSPAQTP